MTSGMANLGSRLLAAALVATVLLNGATLATAQEAPSNFIIHAVAKRVPDISFSDGVAHALSLNDFRGKTVLLNIWATWCGPCRKEMPALDRLQARLGGDGFQVVTLSMDRGGPGVVQKFYAETGIRHLAVFIDATGRTASTLGLIGLPGTLLIDPEENEVGRLIGPAEWDSPEMIAFLEAQTSQASVRGGKKLQATEQETEPAP
jgi:thiol-disulfide isomerase/thioredoxin